LVSGAGTFYDPRAVETSHVRVEQRVLDEALGQGVVALEAGCGRTTRLADHRDRIVRLVGVDVDQVAGRENPFLDEFVVANLDERLPFADDAFDLVYANFVVEHLGHPARAFAEWRRVLRAGGYLVILTSNRANPLLAVGERLPERARLAIKRRGAGAAAQDVFPTRYLANTPGQLARMTAAAGFSPVSVEYVGTLHRYGARIPGAGGALRALERLLPATRRSTIVAAYV
jgi:SAM-dependent methyltransferase